MESERVTAIEKLLAKSHSRVQSGNADLEDGFYDDAASRAYYAAFYAVSALLLTKDLKARRHSQGLLLCLTSTLLNLALLMKSIRRSLLER